MKRFLFSLCITLAAFSIALPLPSFAVDAEIKAQLDNLFNKNSGLMFLQARTDPDDPTTNIGGPGNYTYYEDCEAFYVCLEVGPANRVITSLRDIKAATRESAIVHVDFPTIRSTADAVSAPAGSILFGVGQTGEEALRDFFASRMSFRIGACNTPREISPGVDCHPSHPFLGWPYPSDGYRNWNFEVSEATAADPYRKVVGVEFESSGSGHFKFLPPVTDAQIASAMTTYPPLRLATDLALTDRPDPPESVYFDFAEFFNTKAVNVNDYEWKAYMTDGLSFTINLRDRTPPVVTFEPDPAMLVGGLADYQIPGAWPVMCEGNGNRATTGDNCRLQGLKITDNSGKDCWTWFAIGVVTSPPGPLQTWLDVEQWGMCGDEPSMVPSGGPAKAFFIPNMVHGFMRYSLFAWDTSRESGNLNPGDPGINGLSPDDCYGLNTSYPHHPVNDSSKGVSPGLGKTHDLTAVQMEFPYALGTFPASLADVDPSLLNKAAAGLIQVRDNDRPNLLLRVTCLRDVGPGRQVLFFPPATTTHFTTDDVNFGVFTADSPVPDPLGAVAGKLDVLSVNMANLHGDGATTGYETWASKFVGAMALPTFLNRNFRLEDFMCSDTDPNGVLITGTEDTFGERHGFGAEATILCREPLIEDVEYELQFWAEDNVKWVGKAPPSISLPPGVTDPPDPPGPIPAGPHSGISRGMMKVVIPNQSPPVNVTRLMQPPYQFLSEPFRVVFREPTPLLMPDNPAFSLTRLPSVTVEVEDMAGLTRRLTVHFLVRDEKSRVRIIERQHLKSR